MPNDNGRIEELTAEIAQLRRELRAAMRFPDVNPRPVLWIGNSDIIAYANTAADKLLNAWRVEREEQAPDHVREIVAR